MASNFEATRGLWIGLGVALAVSALFAPMVISVMAAQQSQQLCIKEHGNWNNQTNECRFDAK